MREGTHTPVTAEQIATIKLLEVKSKELGRRINRPFVLLMTSIVSPVLTDHMMLRFDSRIYRFRTKMISTLEANFQHATNTVFKAFLPKLAGYIKLLSRLQHQIQSGIFGTEFLTLSGAKDQLLYLFKDLKEAVDKYNYPPLSEGMGENIAGYIINVESSTDFPRLLDLISQLLSQFKQLQSAINNAIGILERFPKMLSNAALLIPRSIGLFLGERFFTSPFLNKFWPNGFYQPKKPKLQLSLELATKEQASEYIHELTCYINNKEQLALRNDQYTNYITTALFIYSLYSFYFSELENASWFFWLTANATSNMLKTCINSMSGWYQQRQLQRNIDHKAQLLADIFSKLISSGSMTSKIEENIEQSHLQIKLSPQVNGYSSKRVLKILSAILQNYPIEILSTSTDTLFVRANFSLSKKQVKNLKSKIEQALECLDKLTLLGKQLSKLFQTASANVQYQHDIDQKNNLPTGRWQGYFPAYLNQEILDIVSKLLGTQFLFLKDENNNPTRYFSFTAFEPYTDETIQNASKKIKTIQKSEAVSHLEVSAANAAGSAVEVKQRKLAKATSSTAAIETTPAATIEKELHIRWKSARYDSNDPHCAVKVITNSHAPKNRQFLLFNLGPDYDENMLEHFSEIAENPVVVSAKSEQGLKRTSIVAKDDSGKSFIAHMKMKSTSRLFGGVRILLDEQVAPTGETLYTTRKVIMKHV